MNEINYDKIEEEVKKIVKDYGASDNITEEIEEFLFESGNIFSIIEVCNENNK